MERLLIDTNVLVSYLTDRNAAQQAVAAALFERAAVAEHRLILHQNVIVELVYVLTNLYKIGSAEVAAIVRDLIALRGTDMLDRLDYSRLLRLWPSRVRDFGDAVLASVALAEKLMVVTFDQSLKRRLRELKIGTR